MEIRPAHAILGLLAVGGLVYFATKKSAGVAPPPAAPPAPAPVFDATTATRIPMGNDALKTGYNFALGASIIVVPKCNREVLTFEVTNQYAPFLTPVPGVPNAFLATGYGKGYLYANWTMKPNATDVPNANLGGGMPMDVYVGHDVA